MPSTVTVTGKVGPGTTATAVVISNVASFRIDTASKMLFVRDTSDRVSEFEITSATTITCTVSGANYTLTIS